MLLSRPVLVRGAPAARTRSVQTRAVATAQNLEFARSNIAPVRTYLRSQGWENWWIDVVTDKMQKGALIVQEDRLRGVLDILTGSEVGLPTQTVSAMSATSPDFLARSPEEIGAVVAYIKGRGVSQATLLDILIKNPKILEYTPQGSVLAKPSGALAQVDLIRDKGKEFVNVAFFRNSAIFNTAPITPAAPSM